MSDFNKNQGADEQQTEVPQTNSPQDEHPDKSSSNNDQSQESQPWHIPMPPQWPTNDRDESQPNTPFQSEQNPETPQTQYSPNRRMPQQVLTPEQRELKSARNYMLVANICGPVSLFIGGMLLAGVGIVFAILAYRKFANLMKLNSSAGQIAKVMKRTATISIIICAIAFVLNAITAYIMFPEIMNIIQTGDYSSLSSVPGETPSGTTSTWG